MLVFLQCPLCINIGIQIIVCFPDYLLFSHFTGKLNFCWIGQSLSPFGIFDIHCIRNQINNGSKKCPFILQQLFGLLAFGNVPESPDPSIILPIFSQNRCRITVQNFPVNQFKLILTNFIVMIIKVFDFFQKFLRIFIQAHNMIEQ